MEFSVFALEVCVHGRKVKEYRHGDEIWIEGRKGTEFVLRIGNLSDKRILAVPTIDGLSVMDGKEASFDSNGYVLGPYQHLDIPGWRLDNDKVASFRFNKTGKSYASKTGKAGNVGIIGCAFFEEQPAIDYCKILRTRDMRHIPGIKTHRLSGYGAVMDWCRDVSFNISHPGGPTDQSWTKSGVDVSCCNGHGTQEESYVSSHVEPSLGTEFGSEMGHRVVITTFNRPEKPAVEMALRYGDREELHRRGIDFDQRPVVAHKPSAFPKEETGCKPPPGWSGRRG